jgi:hypothetical protein
MFKLHPPSRIAEYHEKGTYITDTRYFKDTSLDVTPNKQNPYHIYLNLYHKPDDYKRCSSIESDVCVFNVLTGEWLVTYPGNHKVTYTIPDNEGRVVLAKLLKEAKVLYINPRFNITVIEESTSS